MPIIPIHLLLPCFLLSVIASAVAGEALTLASALKTVQTANENAAIARERLLQADGAWREAYAELLPQLTLSGTYIPFSKHDGESTQGNLRAEMRLFDPASIPRLRSAKRWYQAQTLQANELRRALAFETADAFYLALAASAVTSAAERRLTVADEAYRQARVRGDAGLVDRATVTRSELESATARTELIRAQNSALKTRLRLFFLLGAQPEQLQKKTDWPSLVALVEPETLSPISNDFAQLLKEASAQRDDIKALTLRAEAQQFAADEPIANTLPKFFLRAETTYDDEQSYEKYSNDYRASLVATWTLYDGGARYGQREALAAVARESNLQAKAAERQLGLELSSGLSDLATATSGIEQAKVRYRVAKTNAEEISARFNQGLATALEQADANVAAFEADIELARSRFAAQQATLTLEQALGRWPAGSQDPDHAAQTHIKGQP
jgi:outer membrane protein TolC